MAATKTVLTEKETGILQCLADGMRPKDAAESLHLTLHTVNQYMVKIRLKLDADSTCNAVATAIRRRLID